MARPINEEQVEETRQAIKDMTRKHMSEKGTAGWSLRAVARDLGMTAPALYHYYKKSDDLITALIVDNFNALADAVEAGRDNAQAEGKSLAEQLFGAMWAYRQWAITHPTDFQLIYGNPIPGYKAPQELTVPASVRTLVVFGFLINDMIEANQLTPPPAYQNVPEDIRVYVQQTIDEAGIDATPTVLYLMAYGWVQIHGIVMLELFEHIGPTMGSMDTFTREHIKNALRFINIDID